MHNLFNSHSLVCKLLLVCILLTSTNSIVAKTFHIGIIKDGTNQREILPLAQIKQEIINLNKGEFAIDFPADKVINANWQLDKIRAGIKTLSQDESIDLIITAGLLSSHEAGHFKLLRTPVIATMVADRELQKLPYKNGFSNKTNYTYIHTSRSVEQDIRQFFQLRPFKNLIIPADRIILEALPSLRTITTQIQKELSFNITFLPVIDSLDNTLSQIPDNADAVYLPPLARFDNQSLQAFSKGLIQKKLPSFSLLGRKELELGLMMTLNGRKIDSLRFSRRIALMVQSILLGTNPARLRVDLDHQPKLAINMKTAKAIGYSPKWRVLETAELLFNNDYSNVDSTSLTDAIHQAVAANLDLSSEQMNVALAEDQVESARSSLLPQVNIGISGTQIDQDRAGAQQAERTADVDIQLSQLLYSERNWSNFDVAELLKNAEDASFQIRVLDLMGKSATTYLKVLLAQAAEKVRVSNLKVSETNLELAEMRLKIGYSDRSEVLRWQSVIATDRRNLYVAQADKDLIETELKRLLHSPLNQPIAISDGGIKSQMDMLENEKFQGFFDNAFNFNHFINFTVDRALANAPELKQIDHLFQSARRQVNAGKRAYYIPDVSVNARFGQNIEQGGVGAQNNSFQNDNWSVGFQASLPLYSGGARSAEVSRASHSMVQNQYQRDNLQEVIEARVRSALQKTKGSFPAVRLSKDAAVAAKENFTMVSDSYAKGVVSITSLIDAQNASLSADLSAIEALYTFMIDWIEIQRSAANFDLLLSEQGMENWYQELDAYYKINR